MSSASDRRKSSGGSDDGGGANWMDTYGDLVTLLLTFFVLLFSMSNIDAAKWKALVGSFTGLNPIGIDPISVEVAIENPIPRLGPQSNPSTSSQNPDRSAEMETLRLMYGIIVNFIEEEDIDAEVVFDEDNYFIRTIFGENVFFNTGDANVLPEAQETLDSVIDMLKRIEPYYSMVIVEGHADSRPISTSMYPSNWHLSAYRSVNVLGYIYSVGELDESRIAALGYGDKQPIVPNDSEENMAQNRRVEFVVEAGDRGQRSRVNDVADAWLD